MNKLVGPALFPRRISFAAHLGELEDFIRVLRRFWGKSFLSGSRFAFLTGLEIVSGAQNFGQDKFLKILAKGGEVNEE